MTVRQPVVRAFLRAVLPIAIACFAIGSIPERAGARPLYAMRTGMDCARCHVDPAGGGIRTATGFKYALNGHTMTPEEDRTATVEPEVSNGLRIGGDFRTQYIQQFIKDVSGDLSTFHLMQSSLYLAAQLIDRVSLVYANDRGQTQEVFALVGGLPMQATVKVGRFRPAFGIEEEDHTTFTRDPLGFGTGAEETGIEISVPHGHYAGNLAILNGNHGDGVFDDNTQKAAVYRGRYYTGRFGVGVSGYYNNPGFGDGGGTRRYLYGAFAHVHHGPFVLMGEYDRGANEYGKKSAEGARSKIEMAAGFAELSFRIKERSTVKAKYERFDPDLEMVETGRDRVGVGMESDLLPFTRLLALIRGMREYGITQSGKPEYGKTRDSYDLLAQLHVSF